MTVILIVQDCEEKREESFHHIELELELGIRNRGRVSGNWTGKYSNAVTLEESERGHMIDSIKN